MVPPRLLPIISWQANSVPLSLEIDLTYSLNGDGKCITVRANSLHFSPLIFYYAMQHAGYLLSMICL
ncbi:Uncharacterised protein [Prevotella melaninogenica]|nr:Uncharacterised protein [Prevotella melaninogenica]